MNSVTRNVLGVLTVITLLAALGLTALLARPDSRQPASQADYCLLAAGIDLSSVPMSLLESTIDGVVAREAFVCQSSGSLSPNRFLGVIAGQQLTEALRLLAQPDAEPEGNCLAIALPERFVVVRSVDGKFWAPRLPLDACGHTITFPDQLFTEV